MIPAQLIGSYFQWFFEAKRLHGIHSPFLYKFLNECIFAPDENPAVFHPVEQYRNSLLKNSETITYTDPGAGTRTPGIQPSPVASPQTIKIKHLAAKSLQKPKYCRLFHRMIRYFDHRSILELGTSFGITSSYMALANPKSKIETIEGVAKIAQLAQTGFGKNHLNHIIVSHTGLFDDVLPAIPPGKKYDMIYIDGNHRGEYVKKYVSLLEKHLHPNGVFIIDDIRWSGSMYKAWKEIQKKANVTMTLEMLTMGLVFINPALSKENFLIRF